MRKTLSILIVVLVAFAASVLAADRSSPPVAQQGIVSAVKNKQVKTSVRAFEFSKEPIAQFATEAIRPDPADRTESRLLAITLRNEMPKSEDADRPPPRGRPKIDGFSGLGGDHFARADV